MTTIHALMEQKEHILIQLVGPGIGIKRTGNFVSITSNLVESTFLSLYNFADFKTWGLSHCVAVNNNQTFVSALCYDIIPTSAFSNNNYIKTEYNFQDIANYMIFSKDEDKYVRKASIIWLIVERRLYRL